MTWTESSVDRNLEPINAVLDPEYKHSKRYEESGIYRYDVFSKSTQFKVGNSSISATVECESELDVDAIRISIGVQVLGTNWRDLKGHRDIKTVEELFQIAKRYSNWGLFDNWASNMQIEHEEGRKFVNLFSGAFIARFPNFSFIVDQYDSHKRILFPNEEIKRAVAVQIERNYFDISLAEMNISQKDNGTKYQLRNHVAVWYQTKTRSTWHPEGDISAKKKIMLESFDVIEDHLKVLK